MKNKFYVLSVMLLLIFVPSCYTGRQPLSTGAAENNQTYTVEYLFEHEGCKVYRFYDRGSYVYFTNCTGNVTAITNNSTRHRRQVIIRRE